MFLDVSLNALLSVFVPFLTLYAMAHISSKRPNEHDAQRSAWEAWREVALAAIEKGLQPPAPPTLPKR